MQSLPLLFIFALVGCAAVSADVNADAAESAASPLGSHIESLRRELHAEKIRGETAKTEEEGGDADMAIRNCAVASLEESVSYYTHLRSVVSNHQSFRLEETGEEIDCVPFFHQPALVGASPQELQTAKRRLALSKRNAAPTDDSSHLAMLGFDPRRCNQRGADMVALVRLPPASARNECAMVAAKRAKLIMASSSKEKAKRESLLSKKDDDKGSEMKRPSSMPTYNDGGYQYVDSPIHYRFNASSGFATLGVGAGVGTPLAKCPPALGHHQAHSLNQVWFLTTDGGSQMTESLETGWIACNAWTLLSCPTTLFTFSTPDAYNGSKYDKYNERGGFVRMPSTPALGVGMKNVRYVFEWRVDDKTQADPRLVLTPFSDSYVLGAPFEEGYYKSSRYGTTDPQFSYVQSGSEAYVGKCKPGQVVMNGKIFGFGTREHGSFPVEGMYYSTAQNYSFGYNKTDFTGSAASWAAAPHYVRVSGANAD